MKKKLLSILMVLTLLFSFVACDNKEVDKAKDGAKEAITEASKKVEEVKDKAEEKVDKAKDKVKEEASKVEEKAEEVKDKAEEKVDEVKDKAKEEVSNAEDKVEEVKEGAEKLADDAKKKADEVKEEAEKLVGKDKEKAEEKKDEKKSEDKKEDKKTEEKKDDKKAEEKKDDKKAAAKEEKKAEAPDFKGRTLNVATTSEKYVELFDRFAKETGAKVEFVSMSSGDVIARVKAEGGEPMADLWFGGGLDAFLAAKADDLLEPYQPEGVEGIRDEYRDADGYWLSKGITVGGFLVNLDIIEEKGLDIPKTWKDLGDKQYKDELIMSNPAISGTNYAVVKGLLEHFGEKEGWKIIEAMNANIPFYGKRGKDPQEKVAAGEFAVGVIPADKSAFDAAEEFNCQVVYPEDTIPWVPEGIAIFKNAKNVDVAKAFIDFMLQDENLQLLAELDGKDPAQLVKEGIEGFDLGLPEDKLAKEDLSTFGTEREAILERFVKMAGDRIAE